MRILILVIGALLSVINNSIPSGSQARIIKNTAQESHRLDVNLIAEKQIYKEETSSIWKVMVKNNSDQDIFVYGNLEWGYSASLTLCLRDASGRTVQPKFISDAITYLPDDKSRFVRLAPFHFLGTSYIASTDELNIERPGRYSIFIEYHSPIPSSKAYVSPFFGKKKGIIRSNSIWVEVK